MINIGRIRIEVQGSPKKDQLFVIQKEAPLPQVRVHKYDQADGFLSVTQFARAARVTPQAIRKAITEGRLSSKKIGNQHSISISELEQYLQRT